jgi:hypothetical protein
MIPAALKPNCSQKAILPWDYGGFASRITCSFALIQEKLLQDHGVFPEGKNCFDDHKFWGCQFVWCTRSPID